ncbi:TPA: tetratricopeptide repeat protein [Salmonella enterica subsp. enterica serovar 40:-:1,5]|nr:tetratricopeptide repeat protein [Salmonella enterica subsp. enterica]EDM1743929.1 hypothetical protein [Salmonella enterica subsp. enterica serovar Muenchen]HAG1890895.1 tetratricopeptide repeat protein [Salmonella enterica]HAK0844913.1 tetratricopeptide repeat protein [Salmonella enterica]HEC8371898.1 tetratricopeptide repeat protein [Salmonella enterica subsp. enterica serovar Muenchen]
MVTVKQLAASFIVLFTVGCTSGTIDDVPNEKLLQKVNNQNELIKVYRDKLSQDDNGETRYKLANSYHIINDYKSSSYYLAPLLLNNTADKVFLLEGKNQFELGNYDKALKMAEEALKKNEKLAEAYNLKGITLAMKGELVAAEESFNIARKKFANEEDVVNNLAMLQILQENYDAAIDLLMPLYLRGIDNRKVSHNLAYALVKSGQIMMADEVLSKSGVEAERESLMLELGMTKPQTIVFNTVKPTEKND